MLRLILLCLVIVGTLLLGQGFFSPKDTASPAAVEEATHPFPSRRQLQRAAWNSGGWLLLYEDAYPGLKDLLAPIAEEKFRGIKFEVYSFAEAPDSLLQRYPAFVIGSDLPKAVRSQITALPDLSWSNNLLQIGDIPLAQPGDLTQLSYLPGAWQDSLPMHLIWAASEAPLLKHIEERLTQSFRSFFWSSWGYEVIRQGDTHYLGYFNDSTWMMDRAIHFAFDQLPGSAELDEVARFETFDGAQIPDQNWQDQLRNAKQHIEAFCAQPGLPALDIKVYPSVERKALRTKSMEHVHLSNDMSTVHLVVDDDFRATEWSHPYCSWLRSALGEPQHELLELGLSFQWIDNLRGRPWRAWVRDLAEADALPPAELLLDGRTIRQEFPLIGQMAAGAWVDYLLETKGKARFLDSYQNGAATPTPASYQAWTKWIVETYPQIEINKPPPTAKKLDGFTLAHEGYRVYNGYGGERAARSVQEMKQIGIDAVAIVPYSFMANPNRPDPIPVSRQAGSENDEAVLFSHFSAQAEGQYTLLKPQIWLGSGSWPGDVSFEKEADWEAFFRYYKRWAMHYALLAELYGFDGYCIGTELRYTTLRKPDMWRELIQDIKQVYHGDLTYAANWGEECEKMTFWEEFDFIGINCYYPLHKGEKASDQELQKGAERVVQKLQAIQQAAQRPIWFTEIGYRSASSPWQSPHEEANRRDIDEQAQARCYEAILAATYGLDWVKGYFWWKWPCDLSYDEDDGRGYMPLGKPAQQVLARYYLAEQQ